MTGDDSISSQFSPQATPGVPSTICDIHGSSVVLYCKDCGVTLCDTCLTDGSHHNHSYSTLKDACQEQIKRAMQRVKKMRSSLLKQSDIRAQVDKTKKDIEEMFNQTKEKVADQYRELRELMDQNMQQAFLLIQAQQESMIQGLDQLALEGEKCQEKTKHITEAVEKLKRKQDADSAPSLSEIKTLNTSIEAVEDFHRNVGKRLHFDNKRLKALENSVTTIVQRNKDMLPRPWEFAENITFDGKTAPKNLETSEDKTQLRYLPSCCPPVGKKSKEEETVSNILASQSFSQGSHYWEVEVKGRKNWTVGVVDKGWVKKGMNQALGQDRLSWALQMDAGSLVALHSDDVTMVREAEIEVLGVFLDFSKGWLQFYNVHSGSVLHTFVAKFKNSLYPAFSIEAEKGSVHQMRICALVPQNLSRDIGSRAGLLSDRRPSTDSGIGRFVSIPTEVPAANESEFLDVGDIAVTFIDRRLSTDSGIGGTLDNPSEISAANVRESSGGIELSTQTHLPQPSSHSPGYRFLKTKFKLKRFQ